MFLLYCVIVAFIVLFLAFIVYNVIFLIPYSIKIVSHLIKLVAMISMSRIYTNGRRLFPLNFYIAKRVTILFLCFSGGSNVISHAAHGTLSPFQH